MFGAGVQISSDTLRDNTDGSLDLANISVQFWLYCKVPFTMFNTVLVHCSGVTVALFKS